MIAAQNLTPAGDPYWDSVAALLHFDGDFADSTGRIWTPLGGTALSGPGVYGVSCVEFTGSASEGISTPPTQDLNFGSVDFTVEMWVKASDLGVQRNLIGLYGYSYDRRSWSLYVEDNEIRFRGSESGYGPQTILVAAPISVLPIGVFVHLAVSRAADTFRLFVNGEMRAENSGAFAFYSNNVDPIQIGIVGPDNAAPFHGFIDELRVTRGVARYQETFDAPSAPFPNFGP